MTRNILIGVGGSGQHVVHAYLRLLALTSPKPGEVPHVFLIDADAKEGAHEVKRSTLVEDAIKLHAFLVAGHPNPSRFGLVRPFHVDEDQGGSPGILGQLLGVAGATNGEMAVAHAFLADDPGDFGSDWEVEVAQGMMANPKVGAVALGHKIAMEVRRHAASGAKATIERLINAPLDNARIAIVGSSFGGTGSGVVPALVRQLDALPGARSIRAYFTLPWFTLDTGSGSRRSAAQDRDGVDPTLRNAALGLHAYHGELSGAENAKYRLKQSSYVLAQSMREWGATLRPSSGDFDQPEHPHVLNIVLASAAQSFFGIGPGNLNAGRLYALKSVDAGENRGQFSPDTSPHLRFHAGADDNRQLRDLWADAEAAAFVLDACGRILGATRNGVLSLQGVGDLGSWSGLDQFALELTRMLGREAVKYGLPMFKKRETAPDSVFHELGKALQDRALQLRQTLVWLDAHVPSGQASGNAPTLSDFAPRHLFVLDTPSPLGPTRTGVVPVHDEVRLREPWAALKVVVPGPRGEDLTNSPVHAQAIALLWSVLADRPVGAGNTVPPIGQLLVDLRAEERIEQGGAQSGIAARVLARAIHQQVIARRGQHRLKAGVKDAQQLSSESRGPMLRLDLPGQPIADSRHLQLKLDDDAVGDKAVDPMDPAHPLSLEYLDPYMGLTQDRNERVVMAGHVFIEHGLKGIPNVIAPRLLQQWRLSRCAPRLVEDRNEPLYTVRNGRVRATQPGIYLHARRVIEAGFWLLVSANRQVEWVEDIFDRTPEENAPPFSALVRAEMAMGPARAGNGLGALVFSSKKGKDAGKPVLLWDGETWFLAANWAAREFFARLVPQLPSVRYRYRPENVLRLAEVPDETKSTGLDRYFARQVLALRTTLNQRQQMLGEVEPSLALLNTALEHIQRELPAPAKNSAVVEEGAATVLLLKGRDAQPSSLEVRPPQALKKVLQFVCDPVVVFVDKHNQPNGMLPLKAEAWNWLEGGVEDNKLVLEAGVSKKIDGTKLARAKVREIRLKVKGVGDFCEEWPFGPDPKDVVGDEFDWSFGIWPNFHAPDWNYYIVSGATRIGDPGEADPADKSPLKRVDVPWMNERLSAELLIRGQQREGSSEIATLGTISAALPVRIDGYPRAIELRVGGLILGSRPIPLDTVRPGSQIMPCVGLDFGTSNTCMAVQTKVKDADSRQTLPLLPGGTFLSEPAEPLFAGLHSTGDPDEVRRFQDEAANFYYVKNVAAGSSAGNMPSELLVMLDDVEDTETKQKKCLDTHYGNSSRHLLTAPSSTAPIPFLKYPLVAPLLTPLPPQPSNWPSNDGQFYAWMADMVGDGERRIFGDLKWEREGELDDYTPQSNALRALYLEAVLAAAFAALRKRGFVQFVNFIATQPEAHAKLNNRFAESYRDHLHEILLRLCERTGMRWSSAEVTDSKSRITSSGTLHIISETVAALQSAGIGPEGSNSVMTIDIGGGTTDVGIDLRFKKKQSVTDTDRRYTSSVRFAGNRLLEALVRVKSVRSVFEAKQKFEDGALVSLLKAELRASRLTERDSTTAYLAKVFFDGIYEYAFNTLRSFLQLHPDWLSEFISEERRRLKVILIGNGFKLYDACQGQGSKSSLSLYNDQVKARLVAAGVISADFGKRIDFELQNDSKASLIRDGGLDAADAGFTLAKSLRESFLLFPNTFRTVDEEGEEHSDFVSLSVDEFSKMMSDGHQFRIDHSAEAMRTCFPLTYEHWSRERKSDKVQHAFENIFLHGDYARYYCDPGAIYLTGLPGAKRSESISTLMVYLAEKGVK